MKVTVYYFAESWASIYGTPFLPVLVDVSPSLNVGNLKYMVCYASGLIEDMMVLMTPKEPTSEEVEYLESRPPLSFFDRLDFGNVSSLVGVFSRRRLNESLALGDLEADCLGMSIDIDWLRKCPVCGQQNRLSRPNRVLGTDNIPDLYVDYVCSNPSCSERNARKKFDIRIARWRSENGSLRVLPLITSVCNGASCTDMCGSKEEPPGACSMGAEIRKLSKSEYCRCGAVNPTDARYCWNCGKKNKNVRVKPRVVLPDDLDELREHVRQDGRKGRLELVRRSIAQANYLIRCGAIVELTFCEYCGTQNEVDLIWCKKCGRKLSVDHSLSLKARREKKPWWKFW